MCSYFIVGNKIFWFFKNWVFAFLIEGTLQARGWGGEGVRFSQNFEGGCSQRGGLTDLKFFGWG